MEKISDEDLIEIAKYATNRVLPSYGVDEFHIEHHNNSVDIRFVDNLHEVVNIDEQLNVLVYNDEDEEPKIERRVQNQIVIVEFLKLKQYIF